MIAAVLQRPWHSTRRASAVRTTRRGSSSGKRLQARRGLACEAGGQAGGAPGMWGQRLFAGPAEAESVRLVVVLVVRVMGAISRAVLSTLSQF